MGTSKVHLESHWVRYEWDSFHSSLISGDKPDGRMFAYLEGMQRKDLPWGLRDHQMFRHTPPESLERLYGFITGGNGSALKIEADQDASQTTIKPAAILQKEKPLGNPHQKSSNQVRQPSHSASKFSDNNKSPSNFSLEKLTDTELMDAIKKGQQAAFEMLAKRYVELLKSQILPIVQNQAIAERVWQDCMIDVWQHPNRFNPGREGLREWMIVKCRRLAIEYLLKP